MNDILFKGNETRCLIGGFFLPTETADGVVTLGETFGAEVAVEVIAFQGNWM